MTIDEAIKHCLEEAYNKEQAIYDLIAFGYSNSQERDDCQKCAEEHRQLAKWLEDYKRLLPKESGNLSSAQQCTTATSNTMVSDTVKIPVMGGTTERLSSTQPEPVCISLNEPIKVKLTDWGKEIYYHQYDRINQIVGREVCKPSFPKEDENGYTKFQLWCFIELYGMHMGMALPNVIEPLEIVYER